MIPAVLIDLLRHTQRPIPQEKHRQRIAVLPRVRFCGMTDPAIVRALPAWAPTLAADGVRVQRLALEKVRIAPLPVELGAFNADEAAKLGVPVTTGARLEGTGEFVETEVQAVYRAIGYLGSPLADLPFDDERGVIPNREGRVLDLDEEHVDGVYATGWIKRGPVGLIGHTKGDALETVTNLVADRDTFTPAAEPDPVSFQALLTERGVEYTTWEGWKLIEAKEEELGAERGRKRLKLLTREEQTSVARQA